MSEELAKLSVVLDAQMERFSRAMQRAVKVSDGTAKNIEKSMRRSDKAVSMLGLGFKRMLGVAGLAVATKQIVGFADRVQILQDRVKDATRDSGDFDDVWKKINATTIETGTNLAANVALFQRLAMRAGELGATNTDILQLSDTVSKLGVVGGSSISEMQNGTLQLAQGLGEGVFRAQEFNSVMENTPAVMDAIARGMNKTISQLRQMVIAGELTSREVFEALLKQDDDVGRRFKEIPPRLSREWARFTTSLGSKIDGINEKLEITETFARALAMLTDSMTPDEGLGRAGVETRLDELESQIFNLSVQYQNMLDAGETRQAKLVDEKIKELATRADNLIEVLEKMGGTTAPSVLPPPPITEGGYISERPNREGAIKYPTREKLDAIRSQIRNLEIDILQSQGRIDDAIMATADMQIAEWNKIAQETPMLAEEASKAIVLINQRAALEIEQFGEEAQKVHKRMEEQSYRLRQASEEWTNALNQGLADAIFRAKSFGDILDALVKRLLNSALFGLDGKGGLLGGITNTLGTAIGSIFTPGFAGGGQTSVPSIVGERGREEIVGKGLFIPQGSARVINAADTRSRSRGGVVQYLTVNFDTTVAPTVKAMIESALPSVAEAAARGAVVHLNRGT